MPKKLTMFEDRIKQSVKSKVSRGRVEIYISLEESKGDDFKDAGDTTLWRIVLEVRN